MSRRKVIETLGIEAEVLDMARRGQTNRQIAKALKAQGFDVSYTAVQRFLASETKEREKARRLATATRATEIATKAGEDADDNLGHLRSLIGPLVTMGVDAVRRVRMPADASDVRSEDETYAAKLAEGIREWWEPIQAADQIRASKAARELLAYLVELAGANPRPTDAKNLEAIRAAIADVFGYSVEPQPGSAQEAPLSDDEHTPPVLN